MSVESLAREQRAQQATLGDLLAGELRELMRLLFGTRPPASADVPDLVAVVAPLIQQYGRASAAVAEDFYLRQRAEAGLTGAFPVPIAEPAPTEQIEGSVRWALRERQAAAREALAGVREQRERAEQAARDRAQQSTAQADTITEDDDVIDLDQPDIVEKAATDLEGAARRLAAQPGRKTLEDAIDDDPESVAWIRITDGRPCGFCSLLSSRGAVYLSRESALYVEGTRDPYHDNCSCSVMPKFRDSFDPLPERNQQLQDLWYKTAAYFSNEDARNAMERAVRAQAAGRDPIAAVFEGPKNDPDRYRRRITHDRETVEEYRRKAQRGGRNGKRNTADYRGDPRFR